MNKVPKSPGCYLFKDSIGKILYIGKAKNIKKRIQWYFKKENQDIKTRALVKETTDISFIITDNEVEALLLEASLIRKHQPKYNIELKTGIRYAYIKITSDLFPRFEVVRKIKKGDKIFGPYPSGQARQEAVRLANSLFKLRVCKNLPKKSCLLYHIKQCSAPCIGKISGADYQKNITKAEMLLKGKTVDLVKKLNQEMKGFSKQLEYELAKIRRDQIMALENITQRQKVQLQKRYNQDVINFKKSVNTLVVQLFNINKGIISGRREFKIKIRLNNELNQDVSDFIRQYYYTEDIPAEIILPSLLPEQNLLEQYLSKLAKHQVKITVPQKGDKLKLLELLEKNINVGLKLSENSLLELQNRLNLPTLPRVIEAFDVSNLGPTNVVGSMVQFRDGKPDKNNYRRFKIKTFSGQSDFDAMKEIIYRRYYRITTPPHQKFWCGGKEKSQLPDLIMVDGGKPQLSAALSSLREFGLQLPVIALAKKEEEIYTPNNQYPLKLSKKSAALKLIQRIRDEAHRFAINYQRLLRGKNIVK